MWCSSEQCSIVVTQWNALRIWLCRTTPAYREPQCLKYEDGRASNILLFSNNVTKKTQWKLLIMIFFRKTNQPTALKKKKKSTIKYFLVTLIQIVSKMRPRYVKGGFVLFVLKETFVEVFVGPVTSFCKLSQCFFRPRNRQRYA